MIWKQVKPAPAEAAGEDFVLFPLDLEVSLSHLRLLSSVNLIGLKQFQIDVCVQVAAVCQRTRLLILTDVYYEVKIVKEACYISEGGSSTFIQNRKPVEVTLRISSSQKLIYII